MHRLSAVIFVHILDAVFVSILDSVIFMQKFEAVPDCMYADLFFCVRQTSWGHKVAFWTD